MTELSEIKKSTIPPASTWWTAIVATWFVKIIAIGVKRLLKLDVTVHNKHAVPKTGPVIVVGGHWSFSDPLLWGSTIVRNGAIMAKNDLWWNPLTGWLVRMRGDIAVKRGCDKGRAKAQRKAENVLAHGGLLGLYPPGSISPVGQNRDWRKGFAEMAKKYQATIVPVRLIGSGHLLPLKQDRAHWGGKLFNRTAHVEVIYGNPITPAEFANMNPVQLTDYVRKIHDNLDDHQLAA